MPGWLTRYTNWLHLVWPAGTVERLPEVREDGSTRVPGLYIAGDLTGVPLLKFALDSGARLVRAIAAKRAGDTRGAGGALDLVIVGAGVSGMAAAIEAKHLGLRFQVLEAAEPFFTVANFPRAKPIFTYPRGMTPAGGLQVSASVKETLLDELRAQAAAAGIEPRRARAVAVRRAGAGLAVEIEGGDSVTASSVLVAIGRAGNHRRLGVPGENLGHVFNRLHDPRDFAGRRVTVVGGGDSALETASALADAGADVTLVHRGADFPRAKSGNVERLRALERVAAAGAAGCLTSRLRARVSGIEAAHVTLESERGPERIASDAVFVHIGRDAPLEFFRRSGVPIAGEWTAGRRAAFAAFLAFCVWLYDWKSGGFFSALWYRNHWFPTNLGAVLERAGGAIAAASDPSTLPGTVAISASSPSFWYTLAYTAVIAIFGVRRIRRRRTPYVTAQTVTLFLVQALPLFLLPEIVLPLLDRHGLLPAPVADALFPRVDYGHGREFWRAYGFILAFPLDVYNVFTREPLWAWIGIGIVQTCVLIPLGIRYFGKGFYCGWICSCGALAETLGDTHRQKMPHGPGWNRLNLAGQGVLAVRVAGWVLPDGNAIDRVFDPWLKEPYKWTVDVFLGGVLGFGAYFWLSGRVWCRFFCPLAALMHVYARFSRFRIFADKKKCISCNRCTAVCHQGIDVMSFANRGLPMADPECVRCSACVHVCPTGVLAFGRFANDGRTIRLDALAASPVRMRESD